MLQFSKCLSTKPGAATSGKKCCAKAMQQETGHEIWTCQIYRDNEPTQYLDWTMFRPSTCRASESVSSFVSLQAAGAHCRTTCPRRAAVSCGRTRLQLLEPTWPQLLEPTWPQLLEPTWPQLLEPVPQLLEPPPAWRQSSCGSNLQATLASQAASQSQAPIITFQVNATQGSDIV